MSRNEESEDRNEPSVSLVPSSVSLPIASQPRPPRNLQELLRYSTEVSNLSGGSTVHHAPLDEESKQFLDGALKSLTVDVIEELMKSIKILQAASTLPPDGDPVECEEALDHIFDYVDNLDIANDFHKIGGFSVVKPCLESVHNSLRWRGAELVAELCQNNPYCQSKVVEVGLMPSLLKMIDTDTDETVRIKALYAVSCLARENEEGLQEFISNDGFSVLLRALQTDIEKLNIKSAFLLSSLCHSKPCIKDDLVKMGYVEQLIGRLAVHVQLCEDGRRVSLEHLLSAILSILEDHESAQEIARRPELQFKGLLDHIMKKSEQCDQYREENDHAKALVEMVFGESESSEGER